MFADDLCTSVKTVPSMIRRLIMNAVKLRQSGVRDKEAANFCDYFRPAESGPAERDRKPSGNEEARKRLDDLFKKK